MKIYKATKSHLHFKKGDYVVLISSEVVPTHTNFTNNSKKSISVKVDIFNKNRKKYDGFKHDINPTKLKEMMDCLELSSLQKEDLYVDGS
ncbi:MAG: hypothetical protein PHX44_10055 [Sulfurimonas sp.]|uniref:hypothetical protein n=1 Tax=Sulfurimonas sp. TaxID=2022749 RepID=UPI00261B5E48|nr:hypothetical protein [Sulfurimonas sp.]MDD2653376.1 hypothetical protein [Sulfurimonas sp.]MDD3450682.1 hypothetical protein [Sulfurimonas sp.]